MRFRENTISGFEYRSAAELMVLVPVGATEALKPRPRSAGTAEIGADRSTWATLGDLCDGRLRGAVSE